MITKSTTTAKAPATKRISVTLSIFLLLLFEIFDPTNFVRSFDRNHLVSVGKNCLINVITAGPRITTIKAGKINSTSAGTIFTVVFALISSARCRRLMRKSSE